MPVGSCAVCGHVGPAPEGLMRPHGRGAFLGLGCAGGGQPPSRLLPTITKLRPHACPSCACPAIPLERRPYAEASL